MFDLVFLVSFGFRWDIFLVMCYVRWGFNISTHIFHLLIMLHIILFIYLFIFYMGRRLDMRFREESSFYGNQCEWENKF